MKNEQMHSGSPGGSKVTDLQHWGDCPIDSSKSKSVDVAGDEDFEKTLAALDEKIQKAEVRLSEIAIRERNILVSWLYYSIPIYAIMLLGYFTVFSTVNDSFYVAMVKTGVIIVFPLFIFYARKLVAFWYRAKRKVEEQSLENLRKQQKLKVEELKAKTGYYTTKGLLERYDTPKKDRVAKPLAAGPAGMVTPGQNGNRPLRPQSMPPSMHHQNPLMNIQQQQQNTPNQSHNAQLQQQKASGTGSRPHSVQGEEILGRMTPGMVAAGGAAAAASVAAGNVGGAGTGGTPTVVLTPAGGRMMQGTPGGNAGMEVASLSSAKKNWYDRVVDALIGDGESPQQKYALICQQCFEHNGLVPPEEYNNACE
ncbi:hypothetical protein HDU76_005967 [Blyttiomyces sp. JEL0837]|nr:hypothetical protein HDU76_005967 [Blyttiomyces sp. JEL0837]